jgi:hypothetical protein
MLMILPEPPLHRGPWISALPLHNPCQMQFPTDPTPSPIKEEARGGLLCVCTCGHVPIYLICLPSFPDLLVLPPLLQPTKQLHDIQL